MRISERLLSGPIDDSDPKRKALTETYRIALARKLRAGDRLQVLDALRNDRELREELGVEIQTVANLHGRFGVDRDLALAEVEELSKAITARTEELERGS